MVGEAIAAHQHGSSGNDRHCSGDRCEPANGHSAGADRQHDAGERSDKRGDGCCENSEFGGVHDSISPRSAEMMLSG